MESRREPPPSSATAGGGVVLGKYQLGHLLGRGSFAKVYHARPLCGGAAVAIKVIDKAKTVDAAMEPRIVREVAAMRRLSNHPNILKIHEVMATKTKIYLVMELATGGDLSTKLRRRGGGALPETTARRYFQQIVSALHFCHRHGVTHRDIKPQNLLIDAAGFLKISDFGLSALPESQLHREMLQTACGTPAYTSPEVFRRRGYDGAKADAWSCGVILFLFVTGNLPFDDSNLAAMYQKIRRREFKFPNWVSKQSKFIIRNLLDPNPNSRMSLETLMGQSWFKKSLPLELSEEHCLCPQLGVLLDNESKFNVNAFDIISMSSGLDLSRLFENNGRERRFTTKASVWEIEERVEEIGGRLGYRVERGKGKSIGLVKGMTVLLVEILAVAAEVAMVVVKVVVGGGVEFEEFHWDDLRSGFED
ncbi:CBL-interacting serine/threonine-protein kinase 7-like [Camellia sinensis]|uniref:CBL-interacting serine/threonine-protein kinase 7-like n=1 Tax=Camellia sinensis TaxID=4442 RepID=UPI0010362812|nr:CBL-interacting serine/threonine-protein kinase 7-like [Camellia sinensis]